MWYHPTALALGWRDVLAAWMFCFVVIAGLLGLYVAESVSEAEFPAVAASLHQAAPNIQNHDPGTSG